MLCCCPGFRSQIELWRRDYDRIQSLAIILIYVQIGCSLIGSLGALYNGVLLINLVIALFALVAIESSSQSLGRTYAVLLFCAILLDLCWLILYSSEIWNISRESYGASVIFSVKLTFTMQIVGFVVRLLSSLLWIEMYRQGASYVDTSGPREADADLRNSFLNPATLPTTTRHHSGSDDVFGSSIYYPAYDSSPLEDGKDEAYLDAGDRNFSIMAGSTSTTENSQFATPLNRSFLNKDVSTQNLTQNLRFGIMAGSTSTPENSQLTALLNSSFFNKDGRNVARQPP